MEVLFVVLKRKGKTRPKKNNWRFFYQQSLCKICIQMNDYRYRFLCDVTTHPCQYVNGG